MIARCTSLVCMTSPPANPVRDIFDRRRRAARRARNMGGASYFDHYMADALIERLDDCTRAFADVLLIGGRNRDLIARLLERGARLTIVDPSPAVAATCGGQCGEEDRLPVTPESFDLVLWPGGIEGVNDVPGALLRCRYALKPGGLLMGCVIGEGSFPQLRQAIAAADAPALRARMHPQLSLQAVGDLLHKVGLGMVVADVEPLRLSYASLAALIHDVRHAALGNVLAGELRPITRSGLARARLAFADQHDEMGNAARTIETVRIIYFSGWRDK